MRTRLMFRGWMMVVASMMASMDSLDAQPPADSVRYPMKHAEWLDECSPVGSWVLDSRASLERLRQYPQCAWLPERLDLTGRVFVGVSVSTDCNARSALVAHRSEAEKAVVVTLVSRYGGCRAMRHGYRWVEIPRPPAGYTVRVGGWERPGPDEGIVRETPDPVLDALDWWSARHVPFPIGRDTQQVVVDRFKAMGGCDAPDGFVLDGPEALARLRRMPGCAGVPDDLPLDRQAFVPVSVHTYCGATEMEAYQLKRERVVRLYVTWVDGGCRRVQSFRTWVGVYNPHGGYRIEVVRRRVGRRDEPNGR